MLGRRSCEGLPERGCISGTPWTDSVRRGSPCWLPATLPAGPSVERNQGQSVLLVQPSVTPFPMEGVGSSSCL